MEWAHAYILLLGALATGLLAFEKAPLSVVGIGLILAVAAPGLVTPQEAIAGFGNKAIVTVGALYVVGEGFLRTGAASILASRILARTGGHEATVTLLIMLMAAVLSAFVNNVLVVVTFLPVVTSICRETGMYPSRLLIPLSYASIAGGLTTLVGTSTNLLVSGILEDLGRPAIGMFEMTPVGVLLACVAILYVALVGRHFLPRIPSLASAPGAHDLREYVTEITVGPKSPLVGLPIDEIGRSGGGPATRATMVVRDEQVLRPPFGDLRIAPGDILAVSGRVQDLASLHRDPHNVGMDARDRYVPASMSFFEVSLSPASGQIGRRIRDLQLKARHGAVVVGLLRNGQHIQTRVGDLRLGGGDVLLVFGDDKSRTSLRTNADFHVIEGVAEQIFRREKAPTAMLVVIGVIAAFVLHVEPVLAALGGALAMLLTGCLTVGQANRCVNWPLLIFIAGTLALSRALRATAADVWIGNSIAHAFEGAAPIALLAGMYFGTILLTELLSNNAVAVIMTPVAVATAKASGIDERALVLAVAFAASNSFANPVGYKTNLLVLGPGGYRFRDFLRVGLGLDVLMGLAGVLTLPWFFPL